MRLAKMGGVLVVVSFHVLNIDGENLRK